MPDYTVKEVSEEMRPWKSQKGGPMLSYKLLVEGPDAPKGQVELAQKKETPAPKPGDTIAGTIESTDYGPKLKKDFGGGGGGKGGYYKPRDPAEIRAIQRQHSQEMALRAIALENSLPSKGHIKQWADWFDADIAEASESLQQKVEGVAKTLSNGPQKTSSPADEGLEARKQKAREQEHFQWWRYGHDHAPDADDGEQRDQAPEPGPRTIMRAYEDYLEQAEDKEQAKNLAKLQKAALGIEDNVVMTDEQRQKMLEFLTND